MITSFYVNGRHTPLSNFYPSVVMGDFGIVYPTVEHAYQAYKTLDQAARERIAALPTPGSAKRAGRNLALRDDWEQVKITVMRDLLREKFTSDLKLAKYLLDTGDQLLVEGNTWGDRTWGQDPIGIGENWLGFLLMGVRAELRGT